MREILFRGKTKRNEWIYGDLITHGIDFDDAIKQHHTREVWDIIPETVGQYTGLTDKNGKKIFEGDIVKDCGGTIGVVKFGEGTFDSGIYRYMGFYYEEKDGTIDHNSIYDRDEDWAKFEVIGNKWDNPELLGE